MKKSQISKGVKSMCAKAMSWSQVCKQISGIGGYIEIGKDEKVRPLDLMRTLGVHVLKNSYKPADIFLAWSRRMMLDKSVCVAKNVPVTAEVGGEEMRLYEKREDGSYKGVTRFELCRLVSADDAVKGTTDVKVNAQYVLRGLKQSVYVDETLAKVAKSAEDVESMKSAYVNTGSKDAPVWTKVVRTKSGWTKVVKGAKAA